MIKCKKNTNVPTTIALFWLDNLGPFDKQNFKGQYRITSIVICLIYKWGEGII